MSDTIHLYVNMSGNTIPGTSFATIGEALASLPDVPASESGKQFPASVSELPPVILHTVSYTHLTLPTICSV